MKRVVAYLAATVPGRSRRPNRPGRRSRRQRTGSSAELSCRWLFPTRVRADRSSVADLSGGALADVFWGQRPPGIHPVSQYGTEHMTVVVPDRHEIAPVGPLRGRLAAVEPRLADGSLADACASADLLLTLATLDPASGGDHLGTWATDVVVMVTAGRSSAVRINAVGEMIRLSGTRLVSAVLIEADRSDESLGTTLALHQPDLAGPA